MFKAYGLFPVVIGTSLFYMFNLCFLQMVIVDGMLIYVTYN